MTTTEPRSRRSFVFPVDPTDEDLARDWTLTREDLGEVRRCRGSEKRHSFAIQLCTLRRFGRFLGDDYSTVPVRIMNHVGRQLGLPPVLLVAPPAREATDLDHERRLRDYLGFVSFDDVARARLDAWLRERAAEGLLAEELLERAVEHLHEKRTIQPGRSVLARLVSSVAVQADEETLARIDARLSPAQRTAIDAVLEVPEGSRQSMLMRFKEYPPSPTPEVMVSYLKRAEHLRELGVGRLDFSGIRPDAVLHLAALVRRYDVRELRRFAPAKRHPMVACFLADANKSVLDHLVEMHHVFLTGLHRRAGHAFDKRHRELRQRSGRNLRLVLDTLEALLDPARSVGDVASELDVTAVRDAIGGCRALEQLTDRGQLEELRARHHLLKRYLPQLLKLPFDGEPGTEILRAAIARAREIHSGERDELGDDAPTGFATGFWRHALSAGDVTAPDLRTWELALAFAVRDALRSGDLYLAESRHHISFWNLVQGSEKWAAQREIAYVELKLPTDADRAVERLGTELDTAAEAFAAGLDKNSFARLEGGALALSRRDALEVPPAVRELRRVIETHLPRIRIEDLLVEVDSSCGFTRELVPVGSYTPRVENPYTTLLAALVAHGTNLGIATMAQSTKGISVDMLQHASRWFLRPETLKAANRVLIDYHHGLELAGAWGDGSASSSDGQRFGVQESSLLAGFYPRYFGFYDRAISVYTHVSDQFSVFAARAISCSPREAIYVLDGLLENDTILRPREHYTDTHGATEQLFGLCYLLGFSFMPRLKDLADQQLYKLERGRTYGAIDGIFRGGIDAALVREQWDPMVRVAASLKARTAPAHVLLDRLAASSPSDRLAKALTMLGRVVKTTHILRYLHDARVRDRVQLQLNRGESRHELARRLFFANQGAFRSGDYEEIMNKVSALSVLSNAVLVWNTVRFAEIVKGLESTTGAPVDREQIARISPLAHKHVIPSGTYHFERARGRAAAE
jgi:TnpA family transposase